jgi:hypothetical protein
MNNYLQGFGRSVGFADDTDRRDAPREQGETEWEAVSLAGSRGEVNILWGAWGPGPGQSLGGGDRPLAGDNYSKNSPTQRDWQQPWAGVGNIPRAFTQTDAVNIQSNISLGEGFDQWAGGKGGCWTNPWRMIPQGGEITAQIKQASTRTSNATIKRELNWQAQVGGDTTKATTFRDQVLNQQAFRAFAFMKGKLPAVHMAHSVGTFYGMSDMATGMQGKQIALVGNQGSGRQPIPFVLPPQNSWTWAKIRYLPDTARARYGEHYRQSKHQDKLWVTGAPEDELSELPLP